MLGRMSRGHGAAQRFLLKQAAQPLGTSLMTAAEKWAERNDVVRDNDRDTVVT